MSFFFIGERCGRKCFEMAADQQASVMKGRMTLSIR